MTQKSLIASAIKPLPFSSSFSLIFCGFTPLTFVLVNPVACYHQNLSEDQTSCVANRGSLEDRSRVTWECLRPRGVLLHTLVIVQIAFLLCFSWQKCHHACCFLASSSTVAPRSLREQGPPCCACSVHALVWEQLPAGVSGPMLLCCHTAPFPVFPLSVFCGVFTAC